jgi:hypothetical protein
MTIILGEEFLWTFVPVMALVAVAFGLVAILFSIKNDDDDEGCK